MRIYRRDAFLALPPGTVYCKGVPWVFGGLQIKGATLYDIMGRPNDWIYRDPQDIDSFSSIQQAERLEEMLETGASYPINTATERDGFYDETEIFLVYEPGDLRVLLGWLREALPLTRPP